MEKLKLFDGKKKPKITPNRLTARFIALEEASSFKPETDEHRKARYALFKNISSYKQALAVFSDMVEKPSEKKQEYDRKKYKLAIDCGGIEQQAEGGTQVVNIKDMDAFRLGIKKLDLEYKKVLKDDATRVKRNDDLTNMEIDDVPEPYKVDAGYFPDSVDASKLAAIDFMLTNIKQKEE